MQTNPGGGGNDWKPLCQHSTRENISQSLGVGGAAVYLVRRRARGGEEWNPLTVGPLCFHGDCLCIESLEERCLNFQHFPGFLSSSAFFHSSRELSGCLSPCLWYENRYLHNTTFLQAFLWPVVFLGDSKTSKLWIKTRNQGSLSLNELPASPWFDPHLISGWWWKQTVLHDTSF